MIYRISNYEVELLLSFYRDIQKYIDLLDRERKDARYGVDSQIYAAFKLNRVSESTKISYTRDYITMIRKAMKSWENSKVKIDYKAFRAVQLRFLGKHNLSQVAIEKKIGCSTGNLRRSCLNRGIETFKSYLIKQFAKLEYTQSLENSSIIVNKNYEFENGRNLELMFYIATNMAYLSRDYFNKANSLSIVNTKIHNIRSKTILKEVS